LDLGGVFMAVGVEAVMLAQQTQALAERFKTKT
jgi:2-keto-3-deoxy-L-rhamnonate aldolase RhmA